MEKPCSKDSKTYLFAQKSIYLVIWGYFHVLLSTFKFFEKYHFNQILAQKGKLNVLLKNGWLACAFLTMFFRHFNVSPRILYKFKFIGSECKIRAVIAYYIPRGETSYLILDCQFLQRFLSERARVAVQKENRNN
jgi:hypothetical protein